MGGTERAAVRPPRRPLGPSTPRARLAALLVALGLAACAALAPHYDRPQLAVVGVELESAQLLTQRFRVRIRVINPNDHPLPIQAISFTIELEGDRFGVGATAAAFTIPARGEGSFDALVTTDLATALVKVLPKLKDGAPPVAYRLAGEVTTELPFLRSIPFDQKGSFALNSHAP
jgi:LEA14-like dessication related protein